MLSKRSRRGGGGAWAELGAAATTAMEQEPGEREGNGVGEMGHLHKVCFKAV